MSNDQTLTLEQAIAAFLADPTCGAGATRQTYAVALRRLLAYLPQAGHDPAQADVGVFGVSLALGWIGWLLDEQGLTERTALTYMAALSRFAHFVHNRRLAPLSADDLLRLQTELRQVRRVRRPPQRQPRTPSEDDVGALVRAAHTAASDEADASAELRRLRNIAILELLRSSGVRVGELVTLHRRDLEENVAGAAGRLLVMGKGRRQRWAYADAAAWAALRAYLAARAPLDGASGKALGGLPLFARHDKGVGGRIQPLTTRSVQIIIERLAAQAGLAERGVSPHSLRHYFATRVLRATGNLAVVQDLLDHRSPETTRVYAQVDEEQKKAAHGRAFGR